MTDINKQIEEAIYQDIENRTGERAEFYSEHFDADERKPRFQGYNTGFNNGLIEHLK